MKKAISLVTLSAFLLVIIYACNDALPEKKVVKTESGCAAPPSVRSYPSSMNTINTWIAEMDTKKIRGHAWDIWQSITTPTDLELPVWETWYSGHELFDLDVQAERKSIRDFEFPTQFFHAAVLTKIPDDPFERPTSFNKFSKSLAEFISSQGYNKKSVLTKIDDEFNTNATPIIDRQIQTSKDTTDKNSFALKPVFQFIDGKEITAIPYWLGDSTAYTTNTNNPEPRTWKQFVVVDPSGKLKPGSMYELDGKEWPVVSLDDFYHIKITEEEAKNFSTFAAESGDDVGRNDSSTQADILSMVKAGNYALLTAMHVTGKEVPNWTWQTFWWSPNRNDPIFGADRPKSIPSPWSNYNMRTAYYMVSPPGQKGGKPNISFNPYLETNLQGTLPLHNGDSLKWYGVSSNCMSCHRMASFPTNDYAPNGLIDPADSLYFSKKTKTDFLWSIPTRVN